MVMKSIALSLLATVIVGAANVNRADALVAGPAKGLAAFAADDTITQAHWVCSSYRCEWHGWHRRGVHPWASRWNAPYWRASGWNDYDWNGYDWVGSDWNAPRTPGCWRERHWGRWIETCPR